MSASASSVDQPALNPHECLYVRAVPSCDQKLQQELRYAVHIPSESDSNKYNVKASETHKSRQSTTLSGRPSLRETTPETGTANTDV